MIENIAIISVVGLLCVVAIIGLGYGARVRCRLQLHKIGLLINVDARRKDP